MKNAAPKKPQQSKKGGTKVQSSVQKASFKKKLVKTKQKKLKDPDANVSIKEKLSGKIFSPTVEKAKIVQQKKIVKNASPPGKIKPSPDKKKKSFLAAGKKDIKKTEVESKREKTEQKKESIKDDKNNKKKVSVLISEKTEQTKESIKNDMNNKNQVSAENKNKSKVVAPNVKNNKKKVSLLISEKTDQKKESTKDDKTNKKKVSLLISEKTEQKNKNIKDVVNDNNKVSAEIKKKNKVIAPNDEKMVDVNENKAKMNDIKGTKRTLKSEKPESKTKKLKSKKVKVETEIIPVSSEVKKEDQNLVAKPRKSKGKRKSSVTSVKDLKPISNIKSLVKRLPRKVSPNQIKKKLEKYPERGVCYFSRIPHGFYENELKKYCSQFGVVTGVYHPVSKNGNSRGYAFVEFKHKEVAEVVAETMNNYLMFNRLVKCQYIPPEFQRPWVFKLNRNNMKAAALRRKENLQQQMRKLSKEEEEKWRKRRQRRVKSLHKKLEKLGVDYEFQVNDNAEVKGEEKVEE